MEKLMEEIWRQGEDRQAKEKSKRELRGMEACRLIVVSGNGARSVYTIL